MSENQQHDLTGLFTTYGPQKQKIRCKNPRCDKIVGAMGVKTEAGWFCSWKCFINLRKEQIGQSPEKESRTPIPIKGQTSLGGAPT